MGIFDGGVSYTIFPGSRLIQQEAVMTTYTADTAYFYDAGIEFSLPDAERVGRNMHTETSYYDTEGKFQTVTAQGLEPERVPLAVRYRDAGDEDGLGQRRRVSGAASILFSARLYVEFVAPVAPR